jgi:hypothetical protein
VHLFLLLALLGPLRAHADETRCVQCCQAAGLTACRPSLRVYGEGSRVVPEAGAFRILGLWTLGCDGQGRFDPGATAVVSSNPVDGEVLGPGVTPAALHCFRQACALPRDACLLIRSEERSRVLDCKSGQPLASGRLAIPGESRTLPGMVVAVVDERPLVVLPTQGHPAPPTPPPSTPSTPVPPAAATTALPYYPGPEGPPPAVAPPPKPVAVVSEAQGVVFEIPTPAPEGRCANSDALRAESHRRVDIGNEAFISGRLQKAVDEYRAALSIDRCDAAAWAALGEAALKQGRPDLAVRALRETLRHNPRNYHAAATLGLAYEKIGQKGLAQEAYRQALAIKPGLPAAVEGLARVAAQR